MTTLLSKSLALLQFTSLYSHWIDGILYGFDKTSSNRNPVKPRRRTDPGSLFALLNSTPSIAVAHCVYALPRPGHMK
jgi:hypothetical protein